MGAHAIERRASAHVRQRWPPGAQRHDLFVASWNGHAFVDATPVPGLATGADEFDAAWLADGDGLVFARSDDASSKPIRLYVATCRAGIYGGVAPLALAFNTDEAWTLGPVLDWNRPGEMLVSGTAPAPKAGRLDIYRILAPTLRGDGSCTGAAVPATPRKAPARAKRSAARG